MWDYKTASPDRYALLKQFALENRQHSTEAEKALWSVLRRRNTGRKFLRQHIVGDYIADFICDEAGLIIEVDGGYHAEHQQQEDDAFRTSELESMGFHVMRFSNEEILFDIDNVLSQIDNYFEYNTYPK